MFEFWAKVFANLLVAYALFGLVFAGFFVSLGVQKLDSEAKGSGIGFRLLTPQRQSCCAIDPMQSLVVHSFSAPLQ